MNSCNCSNCYCAPPPCGWNQPCRSKLAEIEAKTRANRMSMTSSCTMPRRMLPGARVYPTGAYPAYGHCEPLYADVGLNQAQIVNGENSMVLYSTFTRCPGEFDDRFAAQQLGGFLYK